VPVEELRIAVERTLHLICKHSVGFDLCHSFVIAAFVALGAFGIWRSYMHAVAITKRELGNVATALAGQTTWMRPCER